MANEKLILTPARQLFVDSDGVFAHFNKQVIDMFGSHPDNMNDDRMWELITENRDRFWSTMPVMDDAQHLWEYVVQFDPIVLTGVNTSHFDDAARMKKEWWVKHFGWTKVITCLARDKHFHMKNPGDILVDDFKRNLKRWRNAGGNAILHINAETTITQLKEVLE